MADKSPAIPAERTPQEIFAEKRASIDLEASLTTDSLEDWIQGKLAAILSAKSFEEINALMTSTGLTAAKTLIGRTFEIRDFAARESAAAFRNNNSEKSSKSQLEKYCIVQAVDLSSGEEILIDGGGDQFVSGLIAMRDLYGFPFQGTLLGQTTQSGYELQYWRFMDPKRAPGNAA